VKISEITTQTLAAWIAAVAAIGAVALVPTMSAVDDWKEPRRIVGDVSIGGPMTRGAADGGEGMLPFEYDLGHGKHGSHGVPPLLTDADS